MSALSDRELCVRIYAVAAHTEITGDETQWPDVLAYRYPIVHLKVLFQLLGIIDADLINVITQTGSAGRGAEDHAAFANVLKAAIDEQARRVASGTSVGAAAVAAGS